MRRASTDVTSLDPSDALLAGVRAHRRAPSTPPPPISRPCRSPTHRAPGHCQTYDAGRRSVRRAELRALYEFRTAVPDACHPASGRERGEDARDPLRYREQLRAIIVRRRTDKRLYTRRPRDGRRRSRDRHSGRLRVAPALAGAPVRSFLRARLGTCVRSHGIDVGEFAVPPPTRPRTTVAPRCARRRARTPRQPARLHELAPWRASRHRRDRGRPRIRASPPFLRREDSPSRCLRCVRRHRHDHAVPHPFQTRSAFRDRAPNRAPPGDRHV